jgi:murein L,D-transpeptidase YcbB/YkuD
MSVNKDNSASCLFDETLVTEIKKFQNLHGLLNDGIIGKKTIEALNIPLALRIQKIELALERLRWLPKIGGGPRVMVNIPAFQLWAYNTDKHEPINMKVIVGKSVKRKSPVFTANMIYLEFSPYWNIPNSITFEEIIPKLLENPQYIEQQNMELVSGFHNNETPVPFTEETMIQLKAGTLKLRQRPGRGNALGKVKFIFPNNYNVYLHDTSSRGLFRKPKRDLSHGCIRVEKPFELANFLLQSKPYWNQKKTRLAMNLPHPKQVRLSQSIPVIIFYLTASAVQNKIYFYNDIYGYDTELNQALIQHDNVQKSVIMPISSY